MGANNRGVCPRCGHERVLEANRKRCRPCGRAERASKPKPTPPPKPAEPDKRVVWPPEKGSWGRCPACATGVALRVDGLTINHVHGDSNRWDGVSDRCPGSAQRPTELVDPPAREVQVLDQPESVRDHEFLNNNEIPAGLPGLGKKRK